MRIDPDKYCSVIYYKDDDVNSSTPKTTAAHYNMQYYSSSHTYEGQQQHFLTKDSFMIDYRDLLVEGAQKLFTNLQKMLVGECINEYVSR